MQIGTTKSLIFTNTTNVLTVTIIGRRHHMAVKKKEYENLTDANISHVLELLGGDKPITKKEACEILNISYNTTRLKKILTDWEERKEYEAKRKAGNRGKPATKDETATIIREYLDGEPATSIAKSLFRSTTFVNNIVERAGIPKKATGDDKWKTSLLPDECISETFTVGEVVWSAKHHLPCIIRAKLEDRYTKKYGSECYQIYVPESVDEISPYFPQVEKGGYNAYLPAYDLGKLNHLEEYGVNLSHLQ